ncbi:hypothetical protein B296_00006323 [Ensete ventricosum]|uniref:Uncharacterized protein n=1 Tax=Ensete ventricosum TaxID=4639 RepID=A0A427B2X9_ENSVE|nr:hypothetical protein B296_00006323 [Ensete ventricosum]
MRPIPYRDHPNLRIHKGSNKLANGGDNSNDKGQSKSREEAGGVGYSKGVGIHKQGATPTVEEEEAGDGR